MTDWFSTTPSKGQWFPGMTKTATYADTAHALAGASHPGHHSGVGGFLAHLAGDVVTSAEGLPAGILHLATQNPVTSAKEIYKGEAAQWSPLLHGDYNTFVHNFYEHPLGPILDVAGILTGGAGLAARAGLLGKLGTGAERTLTLDGSTEAINMGRYSHNPVIRARQMAFDQVSKKLPAATPLFGESARGARALARINAEGGARGKAVVDAYRNAAVKIKGGHQHTAFLAVSTGQAPLTMLKDMQKHVDAGNETVAKQISDLKVKIDEHAKTKEAALTARSKPRTALNRKTGQPSKPFTHDDSARALRKWNLKNEAMLRHMDSLTSQIKHMEPATVQALSNPKSQDLFHRVQAAHQRLKKEAGYEADPNIKINIHNALNQVKVPRDVARVLIARDAAKEAAALDGKIRKIGDARAETRKYLHQLLRKGATYEPDKLALVMHKGEMRMGEVNASGGVHLLTTHGANTSKAIKVEAKDITHLSQKEAQKYLNEMFPMSSPNVSRELYHPKGVDKVLKDLQVTHKKIGYAEPVYFPDKMALDIPADGIHRSPKYAGGKQPGGVQTHQNLGVLYMSGVINSDPLILAKQAMTSVMAAHAADIAETLRKHATSYTGQGVPKGYVALTKMSVARPYMNEYIDTFRKEMAVHLESGTPHDMTRQFLDNHVTDKLAAGDPGFKLIIPKKVVDALAPEYQKSSAFAQAFYKRPQAVWKHMVLAGRPLPFIVNNLVGNTLMYAVRHAGPAGIHALATGKTEERTLMNLFASRHLSFGQAHAIKRDTIPAKILNAAYHTVGFHEHMIRRAAMQASAKAMPEVRAELKKLKGTPAINDAGHTHLHQAIVAADAKHPGIINQIGDHIDDVAGDYRHFSKGEESVRNFMPFYAWTRHAARSYYRLLTDRPLTAALMNNVGQRGSAEQKKMMGDLPGYMNQYLPSSILKGLGYGEKGRTSVVNAKVLNPEATVADTLRSVGALVSGKPGDAPSDLTSNLSPFITAPIEAITGKSTLTGAPLAKNFLTGHGALGTAIGDTAVNLPIPKVLETALPAGTPGSAQRDPNDIHNLFTPTGKPKTQHQDTIKKDWETSVLNTILGLPVKKLDVKAAQEQKKSQDTKKANASGDFHVAKKRKKKTQTVSSDWFKKP